jgi:hypothetical protein
MIENRRTSRATRRTGIAFAAMLVVAGVVNRLLFDWPAARSVPLFAVAVLAIALAAFVRFSLPVPPRRRTQTSSAATKPSVQ